MEVEIFNYLTNPTIFTSFYGQKCENETREGLDSIAFLGSMEEMPIKTEPS